MRKMIKLPAPQKDLKFPLMKALELRRTNRIWKSSNLSEQELSNLLWAANGITVEETDKNISKRTAPSAKNLQSLKIYVALDKGLFLYDEKTHVLVSLNENDIRDQICNQRTIKSIPVGLIYVSDFTRLNGYVGTDDNPKWFVAGTETGFVSQNVYLYCASANLSSVFIGMVNRKKLHKIMELESHDKIIFTQVIGKSVDE